MNEPSERTASAVAEKLAESQAQAQAAKRADELADELTSALADERARKQPRKPDAKHVRPRPSLAERRERLLDEIAVERIRMRDAAHTVISPLRKIDEFKSKVGGSRQWLYPAAPLLALLAFRLRPRWRSLPGLAARGWTVWRLWRRFR